MTFPSNSPRHAYPRRFRPQYKKVPPIELDTASDANANADENATATTAAVSVSHAEKSRHAVTSRSPQRAQHIPLESSYRTPVDDPNFHDDSGYLDPRINPISKSKMSKGNRKPKSVPKRIAIMAICLVVVLVIGVGATAFALYNAGSQNLHKPADNIATQDAAISYDEGRTIYYDGNTYTYNENIVSVCFIGLDRHPDKTNPGQADAVLVAAIDTVTGKVKVIVLPRDSMVDVNMFEGSNRDKFVGVSQMQLCLSYSYGDNDAQSSELTTALASRMLYNMPITYYFTLNMYGIGDLADAIGGVYLVPIQSVPYSNVEKGVPITLTGNDAYRYCQYRDISYLTSALDRQEREVQFIKAYFQQLMDKLSGDPASIFTILDTVSRYSVTNLGTSEITYLVGVLLQATNFDLDVISLQGEMRSAGEDKSPEFYLDQTSVYETVLDVYYTLTETNSAEGLSAKQQAEQDVAAE